MTEAAFDTIKAAKAAQPVEIALAGDEDRNAWDRFVSAAPGAEPFHLSGWGEAVRAAYAYEPVYVMARRGANIVGVMPLIDVRSPLLGRSLISTAFSVGGGPLAETQETKIQLATAAARIGEERSVQYVELRSPTAGLDDWVTKSGRYAGFRRSISADHDANLKAVPRKRRAEVRKAIKLKEAGDLEVCLEPDLDRFYGLYARSVRDLGTPIFPRRYLRELKRQFEDSIELSTAIYKGAAVASLFSFYFGDRVMPYFIGAGPGAREARAHDFLYWSLMQRAADRGVAEYDFGRSKIDTGPYAYKKLWGFEPVPLEYQYWLVKADALPDVNPNNPKFAVFTKVWKKLPLAVANTVGPLLAPNFP